MVKFVVTKSRLYWWPVKVRLPNPDPRKAGNVEEFTFKAQFEAIDLEEAKEIRTAILAAPDDEREGRQNDLLKRVVKNWDEDIVDEQKQPIPFDDDVFDQVLKDPWVLMAFWAAWNSSMTGESARKGN